MHMACHFVYPDPQHYCRIHITGIMAHLNHVTASLYLKLGIYVGPKFSIFPYYSGQVALMARHCLPIPQAWHLRRSQVFHFPLLLWTGSTNGTRN
jgi:hypothetical protein